MSEREMLWLLAVLLMGAITFVLRAAPVLLPKAWLQSPLLRALNRALPLCVMALLLLSSLAIGTAPQSPQSPHLLIAQILALACVWLTYRWRRNVLLSMVVGVAAINGWLWALQRVGV